MQLLVRRAICNVLPFLNLFIFIIQKPQLSYFARLIIVLVSVLPEFAEQSRSYEECQLILD